mmetsp:Transcript_8711/g.18529  ORF Transcript_8711/g.18529 Transcript_8711/m.18529 type:complete len:104 (-) Transcript_8711:242-553(-)
MQAAELPQPLIQLCVAEHGEMHTCVADVYLEFGCCLQEAAQVQESREKLTVALRLRLQLLGEDDEDCQDTVAWLADCLQALGLPLTRSNLGLPRRQAAGTAAT